MKAAASVGRVSGKATVRDKHGNIKSTFEFSSDVSTKEQEAEALNLIKERGESNGNNP